MSHFCSHTGGSTGLSVINQIVTDTHLVAFSYATFTDGSSMVGEATSSLAAVSITHRKTLPANEYILASHIMLVVF